jgi:hypothetical protein
MAGAATGAGAGAGAAAMGLATIAPSQPTAAVAGVQLASRQHSSLVPFFQTSSPVPLRQLSTVWAPAALASAAVANTIATLFSFFMVLLKGEITQTRCGQGKDEARSIKKTPNPFWSLCHTHLGNPVSFGQAYSYPRLMHGIFVADLPQMNSDVATKSPEPSINTDPQNERSTTPLARASRNESAEP